MLRCCARGFKRLYHRHIVARRFWKHWRATSVSSSSRPRAPKSTQERPRAPKHSNAQGFNMFCSPQTRVDHADICRTLESIVDPECSFQCFKLYSKWNDSKVSICVCVLDVVLWSEITPRLDSWSVPASTGATNCNCRCCGNEWHLRIAFLEFILGYATSALCVHACSCQLFWLTLPVR